MKKVKNQKLFWHIQVDLKRIWNNFFVITLSQKLLKNIFLRKDIACLTNRTDVRSGTFYACRSNMNV
jgi:hypothetical protein